jgi:hypothetical protein
MWLLCVAVVLITWWRKLRFDQRSKSPTPTTEPGHSPKAAVTLLAGAYAVFSLWAFVAWYRKHPPLSRFRWGGDGWFGKSTYAGGSDKLGHAWATMSLARLGTVILTRLGGFSRLKSSLLSAAFSETLFTGVEVYDGFFYEFSFSDLTGDTSGAIMAVLLDNFPRLNELLGFRVQYEPSTMYWRHLRGVSRCKTGTCSRWNIAEDYSGQTYLLAFHAAGIDAVRNRIGPASRIVDFAIGFDTRGYKPNPDPDIPPARQRMSLGLALNAQGVFDYVLEDRTSNAARRGRTVLHGIFEVFNAPYGSIPLLSTTRNRLRRPDPPRS